ncbi:precorrin-6y C5,15-methyltransferase (decarboxylating) subunit CbiE [Kaistia algarum]|uniref:precorrin-6y C5,15-methyltransferase (decarboxylating) subunit CbiE n=1 Tax=Kaistia algarum TaxID=2083279 RepID=UPI0022557253|nr:precorrin-6y C5,15-methyltransferase (decarboxylating) subunit CbiE [Kaistia algarum]MCX5513084.1 precorrin-6y C5,15-methyltransferase (decarboxylating) subunit CbiE [Kaistia algarum]
MSGESAARERWLSIVGIGEDGVYGLSPIGRRLIETADYVFGGERHIALAGPLIKGEAIAWPSPFDLGDLLAKRGERVTVLASGDPFHYGVGNTIVRSLPLSEMLVVPAPSAFSLAASRLGWSLAETTTLSLHGRSIDLVKPHLFEGERILALTSNESAPWEIAALLSRIGFGRSRLTVLEALGGRDETIRTATAAGFDLDTINPLNVLAIEAHAGPGARILARAPGLPDELFETDGQITKHEIRALALAALSPRPGELLWDIGAGSGSIAIEWMLSDRRSRAAAIESNEERADRILRNAAAFGVPELMIVQGRAPEALAGLPTPNAVFIGGGSTEPGLIQSARAALAPRGRLVVNAVTLESEALLLAQHASLGGSLIRIQIDRARPLGGKTGWEPARPILQWSWTKP